MKRNELTSAIALDTGLNKQKIDNVIEALVYEITNALLQDERVILPNLVTFEIGTRAERTARNPSTGEVVTFPEVKTVRCKVSRRLKEIINDRVAF